MYRCEKCGKEVYERFGSGRFCSRACANGRVHSDETKRKISNSIKALETRAPRKKLESEICPLCKKDVGNGGALVNHIKKHNRKAAVGANYYGNRVELNITNWELEQYRQSHPVCEICGRPETMQGKTKLAVDHNHATREFRGLLCAECNMALGTYERNPQSFEEYLKRNR